MQPEQKQPRAHMNNTCCAACTFLLGVGWRGRRGGEGSLYSKNVKEMFVKCSRNEFTCECLQIPVYIHGAPTVSMWSCQRGQKKRKKKKVNVVSSPTIDAVSSPFTLVGYSDITGAVSC